MNPVSLTIIIPTYNSERDIRNCLLSIVCQTFTDYEILIQDGGSTDATVSVVNDVKSAYPNKLIVVNSENDNGIYDAMNKAASGASGKWLYFLGSDDALYSDAVLSGIFAIASKHRDPDMIYGNVVKIHSKEVHMGRFHLEKLLIHNVCHQSIFLKKSVFEKYGPFNQAFPACADWYLNIQLFKSRIRIRYTDMKIAHYNENGYSGSIWDKAFFERLAIEREAYFRKWPNYLLSIGRRIINKISRLRPAGSATPKAV